MDHLEMLVYLQSNRRISLRIVMKVMIVYAVDAHQLKADKYILHAIKMISFRKMATLSRPLGTFGIASFYLNAHIILVVQLFCFHVALWLFIQN